MEYQIKILGDPVLKQETEPITDFNSELAEIIENMTDAMYDGCGIGLAAPQVGLSKKIIVVDPSFGEDENALYGMINPEITATENECELEEGCLSIPGVFEFVTRPEKITVKYHDVDGNEHELEADSMLSRPMRSPWHL